MIAGLLLLHAAAAAGAPGADPPAAPAPVAAAAPAGPGGASEPLAKLLDAKDDAGKPLLGEPARAAFAALDPSLRTLLEKAVKDEVISTSRQLDELLGLGLPADKLGLVLRDQCLLCHSDPESHSERTLFTVKAPHGPGAGPGAPMNLADVVGDVHFLRGLGCAGCHGGDPTAGDLQHTYVAGWPSGGDRAADRRWVPGFCARCHAEPELMRSFNPDLPTDQLAKFLLSPHGKSLMAAPGSKAPECTSCHGVHGIRGPKDPASQVHARRVPETCGRCHADAARMAGVTLADGRAIPTDQLAEYRGSVHGKALLERGDTGAPACNDCHGDHGGIPAQAASVLQACRACHSQNGALFDGSAHKRAFEEHGWPECGTCHGKHGIHAASDAMLVSADGCAGCHVRYSGDNEACQRTAASFHETLVELDGGRERIGVEAERLAELGVDVDAVSEGLVAVEDSLRHARSQIHGFDAGAFARVAAPGREALAKADEGLAAGRREVVTRRQGLAVALGAMGLFVVLLWIKIRRMERDA